MDILPHYGHPAQNYWIPSEPAEVIPQKVRVPNDENIKKENISAKAAQERADKAQAEADKALAEAKIA